MPADIRAVEPFTIEFKLSWLLDPDALRSPARPFTGIDLVQGSNSTGRYIGVRPFRDRRQFLAASPVRDTVAYSIEAMAAGVVSLEYYGAARRDQGGLTISIDRRTGVIMNADLVVALLHKQVITVLS
jgi:hypothetical protein